MTVEQWVKKEYVGRTLIGSEFGINQPGCQALTVPQKIVGARIGLKDWEDAVVYLELENGELAYFYSNEEIYTT